MKGWIIRRTQYDIACKIPGPRWYGVAWVEFSRREVVMMPIPINVVAGWLRNVYHGLRAGVQPSVQVRAFERGRRIGQLEAERDRLSVDAMVGAEAMRVLGNLEALLRDGPRKP